MRGFLVRKSIAGNLIRVRRYSESMIGCKSEPWTGGATRLVTWTWLLLLVKLSCFRRPDDNGSEIALSLTFRQPTYIAGARLCNFNKPGSTEFSGAWTPSRMLLSMASQMGRTLIADLIIRVAMRLLAAVQYLYNSHCHHQRWPLPAC